MQVHLLLLGLVEERLNTFLKITLDDFASAVYNADKAYVAVKFDNLVAKVALHIW